jgi:hypothetical protein
MIDDRIIYRYHIAQMNASNNAQGHNLRREKKPVLFGVLVLFPVRSVSHHSVKFSREIKGNLLNWLFERNK